ncbi:hypothetical protein CDV31_008874 [Fusarium ambrosium]|nr:hypothetical protein CDV31_008874 [Fusarium ambrosium]
MVLPCRSVDTSDYMEIPVPAFAGSDDEPEEERPRAPARAKPAKPAAPAKKKANRQPPSKAQPQAKRRRLSPVLEPESYVLGSMVEDGMSDDEDEEEEEEEEVTPRGRGRPKKGSKPRGKGKRKTQRKTGGINSDEVGDDCDRDSDLMETDGSDDGEDLVDFIVSDNHPISSLQEAPTSPTSTGVSQPPGTDETAKPFFVPTRFSATQESEDIPELGELVKKKAGGRSAALEESEDDVTTRRTNRGRRAMVVDESDSDF